MKAKILIALIAVTGISLLTSCKPKISGQIVTNWVKPGENFRIVGGKLYNATDSKLWGSPIELAGELPTVANNGHPIRYEVVAERIGKDEVVCDFDAVTYWFETYTAARQDESRETIKTIVIYHYPNPEQLVTGQAVSCRCMRIANFIDGGISCEAYDCGVVSTELVPVINSVMVKLGGAEVSMIDANQVADFLKKKQIESEQRCGQISANIVALQSELNAKQSEYVEAKTAATQPYTNDASYVALLKESQDNLKAVRTLANAVNFLRAKYGDPPDVFITRFPQAQLDAWNAIKEDNRRIQSIRQRANQIDVESDSLPAQIANKRNGQVQAALAAVGAAKGKVDDANQVLKSYQSPFFIWAIFLLLRWKRRRQTSKAIL